MRKLTPSHLVAAVRSLCELLAHALKSAMLHKRKPEGNSDSNLPSDDSSHPTTGQFDAMTRMMDMFDRMLKLATAQNGKKIPEGGRC